MMKDSTFFALLDPYQHRIERFFYSKLKNLPVKLNCLQLAEDMLQDFVIASWKYKDCNFILEHPEQYFWQKAWNTWFDYLRKDHKIRIMTSGIDDILEDLLVDNDSMRKIEREDFLETILAYLNASELDTRILTLYFQKYQHDEIAEQVSLSRTAVSSRISRLIAKLDGLNLY